MGKYKVNRVSGNNSRSKAMKIGTAVIGFCAVLGAVVAYSISMKTDFGDPNFNALSYVHSQTFSKVIIDTDAGGDDAVAILLALSIAPNDILAITTSLGNTNRDQVNINVLKILRVVQSKIPVYSGAENAILHSPASDDFYGKDGLGDVPDPNPPDISDLQQEHAVNAMVRMVRENPNEITIVALGPLTNLALATRIDPFFRKNVKAIIWTGGSVEGVGNIRPGIEFNAYVDPVANYIIFTTEGPPVIMLPWELLSIKATTSATWRREVLGKLQTPEIEFLNKIEHLSLGSGQWNTADSKVVAVALNPKLAVEADFYHVDPIWDGELTRGVFIVDYRRKTNKTKNAIIVKNMDVEGFKDIILRGLGRTEH